MRIIKTLVLSFLAFSTIVGLLTSDASAQTSAFNYQGKLTDAGIVATGTYSMTFAIFDAATGGTQVGSTLTFDGVGGNPAAVQVAGGVFSVELDFGTAPFATGAARYLEMSVKKSSDSSYTTLAPRQQLLAAPYAVRSSKAGEASTALSADSLSASCSGCVTDSNIAGVAGSKVTGTVASATNASSLGGVSSTAYLLNSGNRTFAGNLTVGGTFTVAGNVSIVGDLSVAGTISGNGSGLTNVPAPRYQIVTSATTQMAVNSSYAVHRSTGAELTLPSTANTGEWVKIAANDEVGFTVKQNTGQSIITSVVVSTETPVGSNPAGFWNRVQTNSSGSIVVAATALYLSGGNLVRSTDGGATWSVIKTGEMMNLAMSADGTKLASTNNETGRLYLSTDSGQTWNPAPWNVFNVKSVAMTPNGSVIAGAITGDKIYVSTDSGATWSAKGSSQMYYSIAMSSDGSRIVAGTYGEGFFISTDGGNTFTNVARAGNIRDVSMSSDGMKVAAAVSGSGVYISNDGGSTWSLALTASEVYGVAVSSSGNSIASTEWGGTVQLSTNGGLSFSSKGSVKTATAIAISGDGKVIYNAPYGEPLIKFTTSGSSSAAGPSGSLSVSAGGSVELVYVGSGQWLVVNRNGTTVLQ